MNLCSICHYHVTRQLTVIHKSSPVASWDSTDHRVHTSQSRWKKWVVWLFLPTLLWVLWIQTNTFFWHTVFAYYIS